MPAHSRPFRRSASDRMIAGVCGGLAEYLGLDPTLFRVIYVAGSVVSVAFPGILIYILLWILIPQSDDLEPLNPQM